MHKQVGLCTKSPPAFLDPSCCRSSAGYCMDARALFLQGVGLQAISIIGDSKKGELLHSPQRWLAHGRRAVTRGCAYAGIRLVYNILSRYGLPEPLKRFISALPAGFLTPGFLAAYSLSAAVHARFLSRIPVHLLWIMVAAIMNYLLWATAHEMPRSWTAAMAAGASLKDFEPAIYRSRTRHIG